MITGISSRAIIMLNAETEPSRSVWARIRAAAALIRKMPQIRFLPS